jgi:hypothetical protein
MFCFNKKPQLACGFLFHHSHYLFVSAFRFHPLDINTPVNTNNIPSTCTTFGIDPNAKLTNNVKTGTKLNAIADFSGPKKYTPFSQ